VADLAGRWLASGTKRDSTRVRDRSIVINHVVPGLGATRPVGKLTRADCQALVDRWQAQGPNSPNGIKIAGHPSNNISTPGMRTSSRRTLLSV
jgi:hypothetical protein